MMTHSAISYENKLILAPMVRVGSTPMRLMSLKYGADLVYSPEIVDKRLIRATRIVNELLGTVDFVDSIDRSLTLRIHHSEKDRLVVQMGTANPELAVQAALKVAGDCAAIDVNCGCPKRFSVISNMGAALLTQPELLCSILTNLVQNVPLPITCKIRMLRTPEETIELAKRLEATGIKALALHCRTKKMTEKDKGQWSIFKPVREALSIPLIANGDCFKAEDVDKLKRLTGVSSVMVARGAQKNISIFRGPGNQLDPWDVMVDYCKTAIELDMPFHNAKYTLLTMWSNVRKSRGESPQRISRTRSMRQVCEVLGIEEFYDQQLQARHELAEKLQRLDLLAEEQTGELGADCPYIPNEAYAPSEASDDAGDGWFSDEEGGFGIGALGDSDAAEPTP